ncbi:dipeptidyl aminopeptidase/acylaminoacyl peptidase [Halorubrum aidingense JCM 13560]|uniref:Dipeptidyl aminopeptidase/acylaminoacyl peptidase n=1 Tax=Halorubrum aidingense JCM 13560 TaxID=1230454 RepID=M0P8C6_9EURY|nr:S9 family peptidase [Halorubrum aidingense]EMA66098.1 dipeptidyl aminopeptidase/acylaminoacyl peptidase [Halorubrum aidingense JCM 13560]
MEQVTAVDYHDIAKPADPRLSPDGDRVAFLRRQPTDDDAYESTVYLADIADGEPRRLTLAEGSDAEPRWSPSGDRIAFTSTRGADDDRQQLWVLPVAGGEARRLTDVVGGVSEIAWSPDGERLAFVQSVSAADREAERDRSVPEEYEPDDHPDPRVIDRTVYRSDQQYFDGRRSHVYLVDADASVDGVTGTDPADSVTRVTGVDGDADGDDSDADFAAPAWGDADTLYFTEAIGDDPDDSVEIAIHRHDLATGETERVHVTTGWGASIAPAADGRVAFTHTDPDRITIRQTDLRVVDADTGAVTDLTGDLDRGLGPEMAPQWGPDGKTLYFATPDEGKTSIWHVPSDGSDDPGRLLRPGTVSGATVGGDDGAGPESVTVALAASEWDHPGDAFAYDAWSGELTRLTALNADYLDERAVSEPEEIRFESDGTEIQGWVLTPPGFDPDDETRADDAFPLAVEIHGGPHAMWSTSGTMWHEFQTLAARGYVVFWSNPRGSSGYGESFMQAIERDWGAVTLDDVMAGVELVADRDYVDETNAFVTGGSFGGFMTAWTVGQTDYFRAAVSQRGVYDLTGFYGSTDAAYKLVEGDFDAVPSEEPAWLWEQSPTGHAHDVDTPTLLIHSEDDTRTPICTAELYHRILRTNGVDTRFVRYPREGHELSRSGEPAHIVDRIERIARWFDGYSDHHDVPRALDRPADDGLSAADDDQETDE